MIKKFLCFSVILFFSYSNIISKQLAFSIKHSFNIDSSVYVLLDWKEISHQLPGLAKNKIELYDLDYGHNVQLEFAEKTESGNEHLMFKMDFTHREQIRTFCLHQISNKNSINSKARPSLDILSLKRDNNSYEVSYLTCFADCAQQNDAEISISARIARTVLEMYPDPKTLHCYKPYAWDYTNGFFLHALYQYWQETKDDTYYKYITDWVNLFVNENGTINERKYRQRRYKLDDILPGRLLIALYEQTGQEKYKKAAFILKKQLEEQPRTKEGGYWHKQIYPHQMWLDGIYMADLFSVEFASAFNEPHLYDEATLQMTLIHKHTYNSNAGLLYHGWDESKEMRWANSETGASPSCWGRGIGWYMMALVDCLDYIPENHSKRDEIIQLFRNLSSALLQYQDPNTGLWYQVVDKPGEPDNWHETSCSAMFAYALAKGVRKGYIGHKYLDAAKKSYNGLLANHVFFDKDMRLHLTGTVYVGTLNPEFSDGSYAYYINTPRRIDDFKGVAALFYAALELEKQ